MIKLGTISLIFFLFSTAYSYVDNTYQDIFLKANLFYKEGKFEKAKDLYSQIPKKNSRVLYNLGNCDFKLNNFGFALLSWRRAEKKWGICGKSELLQNIALLKSRLFGEDVEKIKLFSNVKIHLVSFIKSAPLLLIQLIFLSLWLFLFLCLRFLYTKHYKFLIATLFVLIALSGIVLAMKYTYDARKYGIVVAKQSKLLSGPAESFQVLGVLPEAKEVLIKKNTDGFYKIKVNGQIGWASSGEVEAI